MIYLNVLQQSNVKKVREQEEVVLYWFDWLLAARSEKEGSNRKWRGESVHGQLPLDLGEG